MSAVSGDPSPLLDWGVAWRPREGESTSGDLHVVRFHEKGALVAVIDGLGHGEEAAFAARRAAEAIAAHEGESVVAIMQRCHEACRRTRGVALSLAAFSAVDNTVTWLGVGNVEGVLVRADQSLVPPREMILLRGGIVGQDLPPLRATLIDVGRGDTLVFATDGVQPAFLTALAPMDPPQRMAERILERYATRADDALALVAQYRRREGLRP